MNTNQAICIRGKKRIQETNARLPAPGAPLTTTILQGDPALRQEIREELHPRDQRRQPEEEPRQRGRGQAGAHQHHPGNIQ